MNRISNLLPVEVNRRYMKAIRELLGLKQYTLVRMMKDDRIIRESEISAIEGKVGYKHLWSTYSGYLSKVIEECDYSEDIKNIMRILLKKWEEA